MNTFNIFNVNVYGIESALKRAAYPMQTKVEELEETLSVQDIKRGERLGKTPIGAGHDKFLRWITVHCDITMPRYFLQEFRTYKYLETNSQSTMHRITKMKIEDMANKYVDKTSLSILQRYIDEYNINPTEEGFLKIKANMLEGIEMTVGVCLNYSTLKTMYAQRKNHRLPEWLTFCQWIESLPYAKEWGVCD